ncbi:hypothetical protein FQR65_LT05819 [Abscondita terminalis]|nr:hypothetical protein FQR65_LT05819 [Abscondita terminalis]
MECTLYMYSGSPAARPVLIVADAIDLKLNRRNVNVPTGEHLSEWYSKINPLHTVPALDDNGKIVCDSHVINTYIVDKYGKNDCLYPKDFYQRALVHQGIIFDVENIFPVLKDICVRYVQKKINYLEPRTIQTVLDGYGLLESMLKKTGWVALDQITLADVSCYTTISSLNFHVPIKADIYPNVSNWMKRCAEISYFCNDSKHLEDFNNLMMSHNAKPYEY